MKKWILGIGCLLVTASVWADAEALYRQGLAEFESAPAVAYERFVEAAGAGEVEAMVAAGYCCENGSGIATNRKVAFSWYGMALEKDVIKTCRGLAAMTALARGIRLGDTAELEQRFEENASSALLAAQYALQLLRDGRQPDTEDLLDRAVEKFPTDQRLLFMRGVLWRSRFYKFQAFAYFQGALSLDAASSMGEAAQLLVTMDQGELVSEGFKQLRVLMHQHPDELLFHWLFAIQCREHNRFHSDGARAYETILREWDPGPVMVRHTYANILSEELGRNNDALKHRRIVVQQSERSWSCQGLANTLYKLKRYEEAEPYYAKAAELDAADARHWRQWGSCLVKLERFNDAVDCYRQALKRAPSDVDLQASLADCLIQQGAYGEALDGYNRILKEDSQNHDALTGLSMAYGAGLGVEKDAEKSAAFAQQASDSINRMIRSMASDGEPLPDRKVDDFDQSTAKGCAAVGNAYYHGKYGASKNYVKAADFYKKAIEMGEVRLAYQLGQLYANGGHGVAQEVSVALEWYDWLIDKGAGVSKAWKSRALMEATRICQGEYGAQFADAPKAVRYARQQVEADPSSASKMTLARAYALNSEFFPAAEVMEELVAHAEAHGHRNGLAEKKALLTAVREKRCSPTKQVKTDLPSSSVSMRVPVRPSDLVMREITVVMQHGAYVVLAEDASEDFFKQAQQYSRGRNREEWNYQKAAELYLKAYESQRGYKGHAAAAIGSLYARGGYGVEKNTEQALEWYQKALDEGEKAVYCRLIDFYLSPRDPALRDPAKALEYANVIRAEEPPDGTRLRFAARAYAQSGHFDQAVEAMEECVAIFAATGRMSESLMAAVRRDLEKYQRKEKPYRY